MWGSDGLSKVLQKKKVEDNFLGLFDYDYFFVILKDGWPRGKKAQYKVYRSSKEVYRNSAVPYLSKWANKINNRHGKNMDRLQLPLKISKVK